MKFSKFRNTIRFRKELALFIILIASASSGFSQTTTNPNQTQNVPTTTEQIPTVTNTGKDVTPTKNRTTPINRVPATTPTGTRGITVAPDDAVQMEAEEQQRLAREAEFAADEAKVALRKRIFGSSLFENTKVDISANTNISTPNNYVLGSGDKLKMDIYGYSQFTQTATINADGFIVLEKAGVVNVAGLTIDEAENKIQNAFSRIFIGLKGGSGYGANTFFKLSLTGYKTIKIKITGEVIAPGTYTVTSFTSLLNALYLCGGPNEIGTYRDIKLIRGNRTVSTLDLYEVITKGFSRGDYLLKDQDIIHVGPYVSRVALEGNLKRVGLFEIEKNENLQEALNYAGGFNQYAYTERIKVYRNTSKERKILDVVNTNFKITSVTNGDSVVVERILERFENMVSIEGAIFRPGEYSLDSNPTLMKLINSAEGLKDEALQGRITIIRTNDDLSISNISYNLSDIRVNNVPDPTLKRQDAVIVPSIFNLTEASYIRIQGAINNPDAQLGVEVPYIKNMTIQDLLVRVGGLTEAASLSKIEIVRRKRNVEPNQLDAQISDIIEFDIRPDLSVDANQKMVTLVPYDEIFVRTSPNYEKQNFITLKGEVIYPGKYGIKYKDEKISDVINRAGGLTPLSYTKGATLVRKTLLTEFQRTQREDVLKNLNLNTKVKNITAVDDEELTQLQDPTIKAKDKNLITESIGIDLAKILESPGSLADIILQDGDEINIPTRLQTVRIEGEILYPTTVKYQSDFNFIDYVSRSGGFTKKSSRGRAFIIYPNGSVDRTRKFLFVKIFPKVEPGSEIIIPTKTENTQQQFNQFAAFIGTISGTLATIVTIVGLVQLNKK
jgi:protein involved in polysaccharide export with SLBB domain